MTLEAWPPLAVDEVERLSYELLFSVSAVITYLRVNNDLLISMASLNCVESCVASASVVCDCLSLPARSTSCSLLMIYGVVVPSAERVRSSYCTMNVRMQCERDED